MALGMLGLAGWKKHRIRKVWKDWCDRTTFHGFNELHYLSGPVYKALFWSLCIIAATTATAYEIVMVIKGYQEMPTAIRIDREATTRLELPDVVLCPAARLNVKLFRQHGASEDLIQGLLLSLQASAPLLTDIFGHEEERIPEWRREFEKFSLRNNVTDMVGFYRTYSLRCEEIVLGCSSFHKGRSDCCNDSHQILDSAFFGCYRLKSLGVQTCLENRAGTSLIVRTSYPEFGDTLVGLEEGVGIKATPMKYPSEMEVAFVPSNTVSSVSLSWDEVHLKNSADRPCIFINPNISLHQQLQITEAACLEEEWSTAFAEVCGCTPPLYPALPSVPPCDPFAVPHCFSFNASNHARVMALAEPRQAKCLPVCQQMNMNPQISHFDINRKMLDKYMGPMKERTHGGGVSVINVFFRSLNKHKQVEIELYTWDTFISNIGGQIGLWMGCSILTVVQGLAYLCRCGSIALAKKEAWTQRKVGRVKTHTLPTVSKAAEKTSQDDGSSTGSTELHSDDECDAPQCQCHF